MSLFKPDVLKYCLIFFELNSTTSIDFASIEKKFTRKMSTYIQKEGKWITGRVARFFKPKITILVNLVSPWYEKLWHISLPFGLFGSYLVYVF
jgi:Uri superfamily endonuclease